MKLNSQKIILPTIVVLTTAIISTEYLANHFIHNMKSRMLARVLMIDVGDATSKSAFDMITDALDDDYLSENKSRILWCSAALVLVADGASLERILSSASNAQTPYCFIRLGNELENNGRINHAKQLYELALESEFEIVEAHRKIASILYREGEYDDAAAYLENVFQIVEEPSASDYYRLSQSYRRVNRIDDAFELISEAKDIYPEHPWIAHEHAKLLILENKGLESIQYLQELIAEGNDSSPFYYVLCRTYYELRNLEEAVEACKETVLYDPGYSQAHLWLSKIYLELGMELKALDFALQLIEMEHKSGSRVEMLAYVQLGDVRFQLGEHHKGTAAYCYAFGLQQWPSKQEYILDQVMQIGEDCR